MLLYYENFDNPQDAAVTLNATNVITTLGPVRGNGDNKFRCGKGFEGDRIWPNVQRQTEHGSRFANPDSGGYLYVGSERAMVEDSIDNANFDPTSASDYFVIIGRGGPQMFCTRALERVSVNFSWIGQGDRQVGQQASAELYYTQDGGRLWFPYMENGLRKPLIDALGKWNFTHEQLLQGGLSMPEWVDQSELAFGIRWMNARLSDRDVADSTGKLPISIGLDEFRIHGKVGVGENNAVEIRNFPREICKGDGIGFQFRFVKPTCYCQLAVELSNPEGRFDSGVTELQTQFVGIDSWIGGVWYTFPASMASIPDRVVEGNRYCIRVVRRCDFLSDETASEAVCPISIRNCVSNAKVQITGKPLVSNDESKDTVCVLSVFDVPFNTELGFSRPFYDFNTFRIEVSDKDGKWQNPKVYLPGVLRSTSLYPDALLPGIVSSYIPEFFSENPSVRWEPGCNYKVRVVSTAPQSIGVPWGPFCIRYCDIETNSTDTLDLSAESGQSERDILSQISVTLCVNEIEGAELELPFDVNEWKKLAEGGKINGSDPLEYLDNNNFQLEVWAGTPSDGELRLLHRGRVGSIDGREGGRVRVIIPRADSLEGLQFRPTPGELYMRVVADKAIRTNEPDRPLEPYFPDMAGTFVRLVVGYPHSETLLYNLGSSNRGFCEDETVQFDFGVFPFDASKESCYQIVGKYFYERPTEEELMQVRSQINAGIVGAFDFEQGLYCPSEGWFTPSANFDYQRDPNEPSMRVGRHRVHFSIHEPFKGRANYVYMFARERNGSSRNAQACFSDVSNGVPIMLIKAGFDDEQLMNRACVDEPIRVGLGFREATAYDIRFVEPDDKSTRLSLERNGIRLLARSMEAILIEFNQTGNYALWAEAINRCGSIDVFHMMNVDQGQVREWRWDDLEVEVNQEVEIDIRRLIEPYEVRVFDGSGLPANFVLVDSSAERLTLSFLEAGSYEVLIFAEDIVDECNIVEAKQRVIVKPTSVSPFRMTAPLRVWPSPNGGSFHVAGLPESEAVDLQLIDAMGREVARRPRQVYGGSCYWEVSGLTEGLYLVQAKSVNGVWRQRMIVQP